MPVIRGDTNATLKDLTILAEDTVAQTRPNLVPLLCSMGAEDGAYTKVPIPANLPFPRKFEAERKGQGKDVAVTVTYDQQTYELTVDIDSDLLKNAKAYDYSDLVREASISAVIFPDYLLSNAVVAGTGVNAYDGNAFYGSTHLFAKSGANNIDNLLDGTGALVPSLYTDLGIAISTIRGYKDNQGRLLNPVSKMGTDQFLIQCPLAMEQAFRTVLNSSTIPAFNNATIGSATAAGDVANSLQGAASYFPDGYLTDANDWYLHYIGMPQKPYVYRENYGLQVSVLGFGSEHEINTNTVRIALKQRFVIGYHRFDRTAKTTNG